MTDDTIFFDRRIAKKFGVSDAIIIQKIWAWVKHNAHNGCNFHDGRYWSYNSTAAYHKDLPFLSTSTISNVVNRLAKAGFLLIANYNKTKFDKTSWYSFTDAGIAMMQEWGYNLEEIEPKEDQDDEASNVAPFTENNAPFTENRNGQPENRNQYQLYNQYTKQEKKENLQKKSVYDDIVDFFNDNTDKEDFPRTSKVSSKIKSAIDARLREGYTTDDIKKAILLMNTLSDWYKAKGDSNWKATLLWLLQDTKGNFSKILEGGLHTSSAQQYEYNRVMGNIDSNTYHPIHDDGAPIIYDKKEKQFRLIGKDPWFSQVYDGYKDNTRPNGAILLTAYGTCRWDAELQEWEKFDQTISQWVRK